ncbi:MAG: EAL domain-containing protein [Gammaproteobacteria bacterium]|nr:EAL domain-containing protein [Gammaproteobacteria bacterium]
MAIPKQKQAEDALRESEECFRNLIEGSIQGILIDRDRKPVFVNQAYVDMLGYASVEEILALESTDPCVASYERARLRCYTKSRLNGESAPSQYEYDAVHKDGSIVTLQNVVRCVTWNGQPAIQNTVVDVSERKRAEKALRASEERYRVLYDENPSTYLTVDPEGTVLSVNPFGAQQLGYSPEELVGMSIFELFHKEHRETAKQNLDDVIRDPGRLHRWEVVKVRKDGCLLWMRETARLTEDADGRRVMLIVCEDITEAHQLSEKLSYQASHDALTGLINRWEFECRLQRVLQTARSETARHALCYLDLDQFKVINDLCGHVAGDELLRQLGRVLTEKVRKRDTLARLGGDEFGVLLEHCSLAQAKRVASSLKQAIQDFRFIWEGRSFSLGVSIGLVPLDEASDTITGVLRAADAACYAAKDEGRNRIHLYQEDDAELSRRHGEMQWVARINEALEQNRFHFAYQRIAALKNPEGEHYELLIRMEDEAGQIVPPGAFLPAAERYDLAARLDRWVIDTALKWFAAHPEQLERLYLCSINLSGQSLGDQDFLRFVIDKFGEGQVPPEKICFEITETATIANLSGATNFIATLKELGCYFALDDFGSGLSSFAYLKNLAVDFLKIDGMFVKDIVDDPTDLAVVISINEIGHAMGKKTIAEFVENDAILEKLREIGVDYAQGYGIGRPMPLTEMLNKRAVRTAV